MRFHRDEELPRRICKLDFDQKGKTFLMYEEQCKETSKLWQISMFLKIILFCKDVSNTAMLSYNSLISVLKL